MISKVKGLTPTIPKSAFVHKSAVVTGNVVMGENVSVWPCVAIRGDMDKIVIGDNTNVQDNSVLHVDTDMPLFIGNNVVVGHNANLHSCTVGENSLIGIGSIVLNGAKIGKNSVVAAGTVVPPGKEYPDGSMIMGSPAKVVRELRPEEIEHQKHLVAYYVKEANDYKETEEEL